MNVRACFPNVTLATLFLLTPCLSRDHIVTGPTNTSLGMGALRPNTTGSYNTASGVSALRVPTTRPVGPMRSETTPPVPSTQRSEPKPISIQGI